MLVVLSPAKNLDLNPVEREIATTHPVLLDDAARLAKHCQALSPAELSSLMGISDKLAILNAERFNSFEVPFTAENAKPAVLTFNGDVYAGLDANTMSDDQLAFAQQHLRILSGLYGVLRPLDLMQAYRLEMGTKLNNSRGDNLYQYWGSSIADELNKASNSDVLINLASNEYFKAVDKKTLNARIITPVFKDEKNGKYKVISFFAKKARGMMARYIVDHCITQPEQIKAFTEGGYSYDEQQSTEKEWVFTRAEA